MDLDVLCVDHVDQMGSIPLIFHVLFVIEVDQNPPMMTSTVDFTSSTYFNVKTVVNLDEIYMAFGGAISWPVSYTFGCGQSSQNLNLQVLNVF